MILRRHVFGRMLGRSLFVLLASTLLYLVVDVMSIAQHLGRGTATQIVTLYALRLPQMLFQVMPIALVLGPLLAMGSLAKHHELETIKSCGGKMTRIVAPPALFLALIAALSTAALSEWVLPAQIARATHLQDRVFQLRGPRFWNFYFPRRWMRTPSGFIRVGQLHGGEGRNIIYLQHDAEYHPTQLIQADVLRYQEHQYFLLNAVVQPLTGAKQRPQKFLRLQFPEHLAAGALQQRLGFPEVFTLQQLSSLAQRRQQQGAQVQPFRLALWRRAGDPLLLLALMLLVIPVAAWAGRGQATERRIIEGALILGYYFIMRGVSSGLAGTSDLRCAVAAFFPLLLTLPVAALFWRRIEYEGYWQKRALPTDAARKT